MVPKALVIDDDPDIREDVAEILDSMGHEYDLAACQEEGRRLLAANEYSYFLLDLEIPVALGRKARIQNGENLLREIVVRRNGRAAPVLIISGHGTGNPHLAVEMMKLGASDYITKPFATYGRTLDRAILEALDRADGKGMARDGASRSQVPRGQPMRFQGGELVFYPDRVEARNSRLSHAMDTTDAFHTYRISIEEDDFTVCVDGEPAIDGAGKLTRPAYNGRSGIAFGAANSPSLGEAYWESVRIYNRARSLNDLVLSIQFKGADE